VERSPVMTREVVAPKLPQVDKKEAGTAPVSSKSSTDSLAGTTPPKPSAPDNSKKSVAPVTSKPEPEASPKKPEELPHATPLTEDEPIQSNAVKSSSLIWMWPVGLPTTGPFSEVKKGLDFVGGTGLPVQAAAAGLVSYVGNSIRGYGQMVVIRHEQGYITVYANNSKALVKEGTSVVAGQKIAETGRAEGSDIALHFELRRQGKPIDPASLFPPRP
jgi:lipoprotein NlpD